jgi:hypothetical protein
MGPYAGPYLMSTPESTPTHLPWAGQPYARVDFIPQSGSLDLASGLIIYLEEGDGSVGTSE